MGREQTWVCLFVVRDIKDVRVNFQNAHVVLKYFFLPSPQTKMVSRDRCDSKNILTNVSLLYGPCEFSFQTTERGTEGGNRSYFTLSLKFLQQMSRILRHTPSPHIPPPFPLFKKTIETKDTIFTCPSLYRVLTLDASVVSLLSSGFSSSILGNLSDASKILIAQPSFNIQFDDL